VRRFARIGGLLEICGVLGRLVVLAFVELLVLFGRLDRVLSPHLLRVVS
jgi:hypothetical protein